MATERWGDYAIMIALLTILLSVCRPNAPDSCRPVWDVVIVNTPDVDLITAAGILLFTWVIIAALAIGGTLLLERVRVN
jgi:hypothetical protein